MFRRASKHESWILDSLGIAQQSSIEGFSYLPKMRHTAVEGKPSFRRELCRNHCRTTGRELRLVYLRIIMFDTLKYPLAAHAPFIALCIRLKLHIFQKKVTFLRPLSSYWYYVPTKPSVLMRTSTGFNWDLSLPTDHRVAGMKIGVVGALSPIGWNELSKTA